MNEEWRPISRWPEFEVSNLGRVRSLPRVAKRFTPRWSCANDMNIRGRVLSQNKTPCVSVLSTDPNRVQNSHAKRRNHLAHRIIITNALRTATQDQTVQTEMSTNQKTRMQNLIPAEGQEIAPENFDRVLSCLGRIYSKDD
jgi:hypothetical protein